MPAFGARGGQHPLHAAAMEILTSDVGNMLLIMRLPARRDAGAMSIYVDENLAMRSQGCRCSCTPAQWKHACCLCTASSFQLQFDIDIMQYNKHNAQPHLLAILLLPAAAAAAASTLPLPHCHHHPAEARQGCCCCLLHHPLLLARHLCCLFLWLSLR
jgi:hypothetical protein